MEVPHAHFSEVTRMVFVEVGSVMMLSTRHTTSTRMLPVFTDAAVASGDVTATAKTLRISYSRVSRLPKASNRIETAIWARLTACGSWSVA